MPEDVLKVLIRTPERVVLEEDARSVLMRNDEGDLQVIPGHEPLVSPLAVHQMLVECTSGPALPVAVHGGMVRIRDNTVTILADAAELPKDIDHERARASEDRSRDRMGKPDEWDIERALKSVMRARLRIKVATSKSGSKVV